MINGQFFFCKFLFLSLLFNMCNALVKYHIFPKPYIYGLVFSIRVSDILKSTSIFTVTRKFGVTFVYHCFDFFKIFEFPSRTTTFRSTFFRIKCFCIGKLICIDPSLLPLDFRCLIKLGSLISDGFPKHWLQIIS